MAGFTIPNNDVAAWSGQSEIFETDLRIIAAGAAGYRVLSGCEVTAQGSPDMTVHVSGGVARPGNATLLDIVADDLAVTAADATLWRLDLVSIDDVGSLIYTAGTAATFTAVKPPDLPASSTALAFLTIPPAATVIGADQIVDKRMLSEGEDPAIVTDHGNVTTSETFDFADSGAHSGTVTGDLEIVLAATGASGAQECIVSVLLTMNGTPGHTFTYDGAISFAGGITPTIDTAAAARNLFVGYSGDGGTTWLLELVGQGPIGATGGAIAIPYVFSTTTTDADPGSGNLRLSNATQDAATVVRADLLASDGSDWSAVLDTLDDSTNTVKGHIRLFKTADPSAWLLFTVSAVAAPSGYRNITVANVGGSSASPFSNADPITLAFTRAGDAGSSGSASVATDGIWDAAGDLAVGTGADTAAKLTKGAAGTVPTAGASTLAYAFPPGHEFDYVEFTGNVSVTATTEAAANPVVTGGAVTYDGSTAVMIEFFSPQVLPVSATVSTNFFLYDGASSIGEIGLCRFSAFAPVRLSRRITPSNAAHTYSIRATVGSGTGSVGAGAGGVGNSMPGYIRITKA